MTICPYHLDDIIPHIRGAIRSKIQLTQPFEEAVRSFSGQPGTVILLSGTSLDCAKYNILAAKPWLTITAKGENILLYVDGKIFDGSKNLVGDTTSHNGKKFAFSGDPLEFVNTLINHCSISYRESFSCVESFNHSKSLYPVSAGLFGYLAYDLKDRIETLPNTCMDQNLPDLYLCAPSIILVHDRHTDSVDQIFLEIETESSGRFEESSQLDKVSIFSDGSLSSSSDIQNNQTFSINPEGFSSNFSKTEYIQAVEKIIEYIKAGDIYQVNLSQRFSAGFRGDPYSLFLKLFEKNPAPFFSFVNAGEHQIISTSPERFIKRDGDFIETRPIKGTIKRSKNYFEDKTLGETLVNSFKDDAELSMIVDLMRNDFGKVALGGTVRVKEHKRLEPYDNVFHLVSIVEALLAPGKSSVDLVRATFPGGSITGCPKIRSMEIIDEIESVRRHVYTGSIGYISFHDTLDLSIAIRTAVVAGGKIGFSVGGGIVFDSDPEKEYEETLHKGKTLMETLNSNNYSIPLGRGGEGQNNYLETCNSFFDRKAWVNGKIVDEKKVVIPAHFTGFQYGAGLFETMRVERGRVLRLKQHLARISSSWQFLFNQPIPHLNQIAWENVIGNLIHLNGLEQKTAAVKIMVAQGEMGADRKLIASLDGQSDFVAVFVRPYSHRLDIIGKNALDLITFPEKRHTHLAAHKSLNYLYYHLTSLFAREHQCDEALICNANGTVSETNTASIISVSVGDRKVIIPKSDYALPGVTLSAALELFSHNGYEIEKREITLSEFVSMQNIMVLNSLMGAVKVLSIDGHKILHTSERQVSEYHTSKSHTSYELCSWLNNKLLIEAEKV